MRFYGMLYGKEQEADSLFHEVETHYDALRQMAAIGGSPADTSALPERPSVVMDKMAGSVWYVPGGRSTIGQMLADAGADYPWADDPNSGSLQLSFETVLERAGHCQLWLLRYDSQQPLTLKALLSEKDGYRMMEAKKIYACNVSTSMFYEETPFRPDLLLQDFIKILHPDIPNLPPLRYYHKITDE
jgi:iron complex transport system substrate-binding protein